MLGKQIVVARRLIDGDQPDRLVAEVGGSVRNLEITLVDRLERRAVGLERRARAGGDGRFEGIAHAGEFFEVIVGFAVGKPEFVAFHQLDDQIGIVVRNLVSDFVARLAQFVGIDRTVLLSRSQHDGLHLGARRREVHVIRNHIGRTVVFSLLVVSLLHAQRNAVRNLAREEVGCEIRGTRCHDEAAVARLVGSQRLDIQRGNGGAGLHLLHLQREHRGVGSPSGNELCGGLDRGDAEGHLDRTVRQQNGVFAFGCIVERVDRSLVIVISRNIDEALDTAQQSIDIQPQAVDQVLQILHRPLVFACHTRNRTGDGFVDRSAVGKRLIDAIRHTGGESGIRRIVFDLGVFERFEPALDVGQRTVGVGVTVERVDLSLQILNLEIERVFRDKIIPRQNRLHRFAQRVFHRLLTLADRLLHGLQRRIVGQIGSSHITFERRSEP